MNTVTIQNIKLIVFFGSRSRGTAGACSDADIAVLGDHPLSYEELSDISVEVADMLHISEDNIDIVDLWNASPLLLHQVGETGKLLYGSESDFTRFRVLSWKRYQDTAKFRRAREKHFDKKYGQ
mgnify:FL=1